MGEDQNINDSPQDEKAGNPEEAKENIYNEQPVESTGRWTII